MSERAAWHARWTADAATLLEGGPSRGRAALEALFVVAVVGVGELRSSLLLCVACAVAGLLLVRPWRASHGGRAARALAGLATIATIGFSTAPAAVPEGRRIGVTTEPVAPRPGDPAAGGGVLEVRAIASAMPASSALRIGDRILAIDGAPLDAKAPNDDLRARVQRTSDVTRLELAREGRAVSVELRVPRAAKVDPLARALGELALRHVLLATVMRAACLLVFAFLLLRGHGRSLDALGIGREGLARDLIEAVPLAVGAFATSIGVGLAARALGALARSRYVEQEATARSSVLQTLFGGTPILAFVAAMIVTAAFEEVVFRGLLLPRLRAATGSWGLALILASLAFGAGHLYEGLVAVAQTTALGLYFGLAFLRLRRLLPVIVAHASFNVVVFLLLTLAAKRGL